MTRQREGLGDSAPPCRIKGNLYASVLAGLISLIALSADRTSMAGRGKVVPGGLGRRVRLFRRRALKEPRPSRRCFLPLRAYLG